MAEEPVKKAGKSKKVAEDVTETNNDVFDPRAGLTDEQLGLRDRLEELAREYAQDEREKAWLTDMCLFRYLRARDWKLEKAEKMLKATMDWRREWKVEDIQREDVILTLNLKSLYRNGVDKEGRPVMFIKPSYNGNTVEYRLKSLIYSLEESIESMDVGKGVEKMTLIADFEVENKLEKKSPDQTTVARSFLGFLQNHYPERLAHAFALNAPWYIRLLFTLISPFMDPVTKKKIHFVTGDTAHIKKHLLQYIEEDQLESCYGGTRSLDAAPDLRHLRHEREAAAAASSSASTTTEKPKKKKKKAAKPSESEDDPSAATPQHDTSKPQEDEESSSDHLPPGQKQKKKKKKHQEEETNESSAAPTASPTTASSDAPSDLPSKSNGKSEAKDDTSSTHDDVDDTPHTAEHEVKPKKKKKKDALSSSSKPSLATAEPVEAEA